jgi:hypothetical protein
MSIKYHINESLEIIPSNQDANRLVKHDIEIFIGIVLKELQNVSAIVLEGSYGRQEGAYLEKMGVLDLQCLVTLNIDLHLFRGIE